MKTQTYPFIPKSTKHLERGHYWAIPLSDGSYGACCVIGKCLIDGKPRSRLFLAGVLSWNGKELPSANELEMYPIFQYGFAHIKTIKESGGNILGKANIDFDQLQHSAESLSIITWGYNMPTLLATKCSNEIIANKN